MKWYERKCTCGASAATNKQDEENKKRIDDWYAKHLKICGGREKCQRRMV